MNNFSLWGVLAAIASFLGLYIWGSRNQKRVADALAKVAIQQDDKNFEKKRWELDLAEEKEKELNAKREESAKKFRDAVHNLNESDRSWRPSDE